MKIDVCKNCNSQFVNQEGYCKECFVFKNIEDSTMLEKMKLDYEKLLGIIHKKNLDPKVEFNGKNFKKMMFSNDGEDWKMLYFVGMDYFYRDGLGMKKKRPTYYALGSSCSGYAVGYNVVIPFMMCKEVENED